MSEFEFLRNVTIGQYLPTGSWLHRRDPRARILAIVVLVTVVTFSPRLTGLFLCLGILVIGLIVGKISPRYVLRGIVPFLPILILVAVLQILFNPYSDTPPLWLSIGSWALSPVDLIAAGMVLVRFAALVVGISLGSFCLSTFEMTQGLEALLSPLSRLHLPTQDLVLMVQITLRFLPILAQSAERIAKAQAARGAEWGGKKGSLFQRIKQFYPLLLPLFLNSLRRAENLALAMDARGYSSNNRRTILADLHFGWMDAGLTLGAIVCAVLAIMI
ncbi:MAG TPA: energy-coupling factor transporter transmembrane component T [Anaerolineaceae bacterium]|nr:energy-coupling factor transporter transmembrane component T [Anaerolineaceae bacterium]